MLLRSSTAASSFVASHTLSASQKSPTESTKSCRLWGFSAAKGKGVDCARCGTVTVKAAQSAEAEATALTGVVFQPFQELKSPLVQLPSNSSHSLARHRYAPACEAAINEQINVEYTVSYIYHALFAYFDRDNIALPGFARFFKESSEEERGHAEKFMKYQNMRGGRVQLHSLLQPALFEFDHSEKGDALYAMEVTLSLEKLTNEKLLNLHKIADENNDPQLQDFLETEYLDEQVAAIKKISEYVSQLRRIGKGHGVYHFDLLLQKDNVNENGAL